MIKRVNRLPRYKRLTPEELAALPPLAEMKLQTKILRAFPSSPLQKELQQQLAALRATRLSEVSK